jgi:hypothetical protein
MRKERGQTRLLLQRKSVAASGGWIRLLLMLYLHGCRMMVDYIHPMFEILPACGLSSTSASCLPGATSVGSGIAIECGEAEPLCLETDSALCNLANIDLFLICP